MVIYGSLESIGAQKKSKKSGLTPNFSGSRGQGHLRVVEAGRSVAETGRGSGAQGGADLEELHQLQQAAVVGHHTPQAAATATGQTQDRRATRPSPARAPGVSRSGHQDFPRRPARRLPGVRQRGGRVPGPAAARPSADGDRESRRLQGRASLLSGLVRALPESPLPPLPGGGPSRKACSRSGSPRWSPT